MKLGIFTAFRDMHKYYVKSCEELGIAYEIIDIIGADWLSKVLASDCDGFLCRPPSEFQERKSMFDEKLYIIDKLIGKPIYPSYNELLIYENKRMMSYWLDLNNFPHAPTRVFYQKKEFLNFLKNTAMPIVLKNNIGSTSKGVLIVKNKVIAGIIANLVFGLGNAKLALGYTSQMTGKILPFPALGTMQKHYLIVQDFERIKWEWRVIKIGNSFFGHKKLLKGNFASGSGKVGWDIPPENLLLMVKNICDVGKFHSMAVDVFETLDGRFLVNELQSIFGSYDNSQMYFEGKPGRFILENGKFIFEEGVFNKHGSYLLRVKHFVDLLNQKEV
jgi:glutathione synthase/RimK-type ligase-like ATP-grasp enzyme